MAEAQGNSKGKTPTKILTDLSLSYTPKSWLTFTAGANNILDVYPDRIQDARNTQEGTFIYSLEASPFGFYEDIIL